MLLIELNYVQFTVSGNWSENETKKAQIIIFFSNLKAIEVIFFILRLRAHLSLLAGFSKKRGPFKIWNRNWGTFLLAIYFLDIIYVNFSALFSYCHWNVFLSHAAVLTIKACNYYNLKHQIKLFRFFTEPYPANIVHSLLLAFLTICLLIANKTIYLKYNQQSPLFWKVENKFLQNRYRMNLKNRRKEDFSSFLTFSTILAFINNI